MTSSPPSPVPNSPGPEEAWSVKGFINFVNTVSNMILDLFDVVVEPFFKINETGRIVRSLLFVIGFILWLILAYTAHPPQFNIEPWFTFPYTGNTSTDLMLQTLGLLQLIIQRIIALIVPFFAPDVFRHVLVIGLASWIAFQWAAIYLDDIFELKDTNISQQFIRGAAFVGTLEKVHIADGEVVAKYKNSPVIRIGGPGKVIVHLENAALFEKINGEAHIILSEDKDKKILLEGFERLRTVKSVSPKQPDGYAIFDRRDQFIGSQTMTGRTKDGIIVTAKNISSVFSIHQGPVEVAESNVPKNSNGKVIVPQISRRLSFEREALESAIRNLIYNQVNRPWTETAKQSIFPSVRIWIGQHTLDEFLTNLSPQELAEVRERLQSSSGQNPLAAPPSVYLSRAEITNYVQGNPENWVGRGFDVYWVGVGTWETPEEIPQQHKQAFELSVQNRILGSELELSRLLRESRLLELKRLIHDVPLRVYKYIRSIDPLFSNRQNAEELLDVAERLMDPNFQEHLGRSKHNSLGGGSPFRRTEPESPQKIKYNLMVAYREKLKNTKEWYERNQQIPPEELVAVINHLAQFQPPSDAADK